jgi:UDPglucose--hexose-1-phosphate uridylyltransferase
LNNSHTPPTQGDNTREQPHRRYNALTGEWVLVSPHRTQRPWLGQVEKPIQDARPPYDPDCYLCPGNKRAGGNVNPNYPQTYIFENDFPALLPEIATKDVQLHSLLRSQSVPGVCRVMCFSPRHDLTLAEMEESEIRHILDIWGQQVKTLGQQYTWVQVYENKGEIMGCSNPHPHGQIWGIDVLPNEAYKEDVQQLAYFKQHNHPLLLDYVNLELERDERLVLYNQDWAILVPFWAIWPFEALLLPRFATQSLHELGERQRDSLAAILKNLLTKYDNLFETSFPYSFGWHGRPMKRGDCPHWQLHAHFYPPLLRSASIKKFMVGFEMLGEVQRDLTPEEAAWRLRAQSDLHYKEQESG